MSIEEPQCVINVAWGIDDYCVTSAGVSVMIMCNERMVGNVPYYGE